MPGFPKWQINLDKFHLGIPPIVNQIATRKHVCACGSPTSPPGAHTPATGSSPNPCFLWDIPKILQVLLAKPPGGYPPIPSLAVPSRPPVGAPGSSWGIAVAKMSRDHFGLGKGTTRCGRPSCERCAKVCHSNTRPRKDGGFGGGRSNTRPKKVLGGILRLFLRGRGEYQVCPCYSLGGGDHQDTIGIGEYFERLLTYSKYRFCFFGGYAFLV